ncbi:MAG: ABC transporter permease [Leptospirillum sp.]
MVNDTIEKAKKDILESLSSYHIWLSLGWQDIKQRYRRSALGPWWITLSLGLTILSMGFLYAKLFKQDIHTYLPFLAIGMVFWNLVSVMITESSTVFLSAEGIIKQIPMAFGIHILRMIWRNVIIFLHNMLVVLGVLLYFGDWPGTNILLFPIVVILVMANGFWVGILVGILGTRFRDIAQIISSVVQILFFLTPVMWTPSSLTHKVWIMKYNPLYYVLEIARNSLMGGAIPYQSYGVVLAVTVLGWLLAFRFLVRYRSRIPYWL